MFRRTLAALTAACAVAFLSPVDTAVASVPLAVDVGTSIEGGTGLAAGQSWPSRLDARWSGQIVDHSLPGGSFTHPFPDGTTIRTNIDQALAQWPNMDELIIGGPVNDLVVLDITQMGDLKWAVYNAVGAAYAAGVDRVVVVGILPFTDCTGCAFPAGWWGALEARRLDYNAWAAAMWGVNYVDLSGWLTQTSSTRGDARWFRDGLHLHRIGAALIGEAFPLDALPTS